MRPKTCHPSQTPDPRSRRGGFHSWIAVAVVLAALAAFAPTLDSDTFITASDSILRLPLLSHYRHVPTIFTQEFMSFSGGRYRPVPYALLAVVRTVVAADNAIFWHVWLLAFHVLNAALIYTLAKRFSTKHAAALVALGIFLLHPLASAFGNRINLFPHVLGGTFYLGALLCYLRHTRRGNVAAYLAGVLLFALGLLTSLALLTLPLLILLYEWLYVRTRPLRVVVRVLPFGVVIAACVPCFLTFHPHPLYYAYAPTPHPSATWYWMYSFAAGRLDGVIGLLRGWSTPAAVSGWAGRLRDAWSLSTLFWGAVLAAALALSVRGLLSKRWFAVGAFLLLLGVQPYFGSPQLLMQDYASWSYQYLPLAGLALLTGAAADTALVLLSRAWRRDVVAAAAVIVAVCAVLLVVANVHARTPKAYARHALKVNPNSEVAAVRLGKAYLAEQDEGQALTYLFRPTVSSVRESCLAMAQHYNRLGQTLAAAVHMSVVNREDKYGLQLQDDSITMAEIMQKVGAIDFAEQHVGWTLMADPKNTDALGRLADILASKGHLHAALSCLEGVAEIKGADRENAARMLALKRRLYDPERYDAPSRITPPDPALLRYASQQGRGEHIRDAVIRLAHVHTEDPILQLISGVFLSEGGRHERALERIDAALARLSSYSYAWASKCWAAASARKPQLAWEAFRSVHDFKPWDAMTWQQLGYMLSSEGHYELAIACFRLALRVNPRMSETHNNLAVLLAGRGDFHEALSHFRQALDLPRDRLGGVHNGMGFVLMQLGELDEAIEHYREAIAIEPGRARAYRNMADALRRQGRFAESIETLSRAIKEVPGDVEVSAELAWVLATAPQDELRDGERAVHLAQHLCREASGGTARLLDILAAAYAETGRFDEAVATAQRAVYLARVQKDPELAHLIDRRRLLYRTHRPYRLPLGPE